MDCIVHGVAKSQTGLSDLHFHFHFLHTIGSEVGESADVEGQLYS